MCLLRRWRRAERRACGGQFPTGNGWLDLGLIGAGLFGLRVLVVTRRIVVAKRIGVNSQALRVAKKFPGPFEKEMSHSEASLILNVK